MKKYTVRLKDNTVGTIDSDTILDADINSYIGTTVDVYLYDENDNYIEVSGKLVEVLDEN